MWAALLHTYWDWVSMLMLMLLELIIYFVFVFRMLFIAFYFIFHTRKVSERDHALLIPSLRCDLCRKKLVCIIRCRNHV